MEEIFALGGGIIGLIIVLFIIAIAILWFLLPFAVFGIKIRLDNIISELSRANTLLSYLKADLTVSKPATNSNTDDISGETGKETK